MSTVAGGQPKAQPLGYQDWLAAYKPKGETLKRTLEPPHPSPQLPSSQQPLEPLSLPQPTSKVNIQQRRVTRSTSRALSTRAEVAASSELLDSRSTLPRAYLEVLATPPPSFPLGAHYQNILANQPLSSIEQPASQYQELGSSVSSPPDSLCEGAPLFQSPAQAANPNASIGSSSSVSGRDRNYNLLP